MMANELCLLPLAVVVHSPLRPDLRSSSQMARLQLHQISTDDDPHSCFLSTPTLVPLLRRRHPASHSSRVLETAPTAEQND